jgi:hypothetical protein
MLHPAASFKASYKTQEGFPSSPRAHLPRLEWQQREKPTAMRHEIDRVSVSVGIVLGTDRPAMKPRCYRVGRAT